MLRPGLLSLLTVLLLAAPSAFADTAMAMNVLNKGSDTSAGPTEHAPKICYRLQVKDAGVPSQ